jgi:hypothetical protein
MASVDSALHMNGIWYLPVQDVSLLFRILFQDRVLRHPIITIYAPMIYTVPCVMFLMRADTLRGEVVGGCALEISSGAPINFTHRLRLHPPPPPPPHAV